MHWLMPVLPRIVLAWFGYIKWILVNNTLGWCSEKVEFDCGSFMWLKEFSYLWKKKNKKTKIN